MFCVFVCVLCVCVCVCVCVQHYPMLEAWVLLWLPDAERQAVSGHLKALKEHLGVPAASLQPAQLQGSLK